MSWGSSPPFFHQRVGLGDVLLCRGLELRAGQRGAPECTRGCAAVCWPPAACPAAVLVPYKVSVSWDSSPALGCPTRCLCPGICPQPLHPGATTHGRVGEALVPPLQREEAKFWGHPWHQAPHLGAAAACARLGLRLLPKSGRELLEDGHGGLTATHRPPPAAALPAWWHTQQAIFLCRA